MQRTTCFILLGSVHSGVFLPVSDGRLRKNSFYWDLRKCIFSDWHIFLCDSDKSINLTQACNKNWCKLLINLQPKLLYFCRCFFCVFATRYNSPLQALNEFQLSAHYLFYSLIFLWTGPMTLALLPVILFALLHSASYSLRLLDTLGQWNRLHTHIHLGLIIEVQA